MSLELRSSGHISGHDPSGCGIDRRDVVAAYQRITGDQRQTLDPRLRHEEPVEGVPMYVWQLTHALGVCCRDREQLEPGCGHGLHEVGGALSFPRQRLMAISQTVAALIVAD